MKNSETVERLFNGLLSCRGREIMLNVRIATPPWDRSKNGWMDVNPGIASSYFAQKPEIRLPFQGLMASFL